MGRQCLQRGRITYSWTQVSRFVKSPGPQSHTRISLCPGLLHPLIRVGVSLSRTDNYSAGTSYLPDSLLNLPFSTYSTRNVPIRRSFSSPHSLSLSPSFHDHVHTCHVLIPDVVLSSPFFQHCIALSLSYTLGDHFGSGAKLGTGQRPCHSWDSGPLVLKPNYPNDILIPFRLRPDIYVRGRKKNDAPLPYAEQFSRHTHTRNLSQVIRLL